MTTGSTIVITSDNQVPAIDVGDLIQFTSQSSVNYTVTQVSTTGPSGPGQLTLYTAYSGVTKAPTTATVPLVGTFGVTISSNHVSTSTSQVGAVNAGDKIQFASQNTIYTVLVVSGTPGTGYLTLTTPYTGETDNSTTAQLALVGTFSVTLGSPNVVTSVSHVGFLTGGQTIEFAAQPFTSYTVLSVTITEVVLTTNYTGTTTASTPASLIAATPQVGNLVRIASGAPTTHSGGGNWRPITTVHNITPAYVEVASSDAWTGTEPSGGAATITVTAGVVTVTGLTGMTAAEVNSVLIITSPSQPSTNSGTWPIASYISSSSVTITNPNAVTDTGGDTWSVAFAFAIAISAADVTGTATFSGTMLTDSRSTADGPFLGGAITMLGNTYGVMTFVGNSYNTTTLDTIIPIVPATAPPADAKYWGLLDEVSGNTPTAFGSPVSIGDIVTGPGVVTSPPTTVVQIGPGQSIQLSQATTGGSQTAAIFELQFTQPPPTATILDFKGTTFDTTIAGGPAATPPTAAASITGFSTPSVTLSNMVSTPMITAAVVGNLITITGANNAANNGTFVITAFVNSTPNPGVQYSNINAVYPDNPPTENISWSIPPSPTINVTSGGTIENNLAGVSIGDLVDNIPSGPGPIASGSYITQITQTGPGAFSLTLNNAATSAAPNVPFSITTRAPVSPWSTTVDSLQSNIYAPTQPTTDGFIQAMTIAPIVVSGYGIAYNPDISPPQFTTIVGPLGSPPGTNPTTSFTMTSTITPFGVASSSTETGLPLAYSNATKSPTILTIYVPYTVNVGWTVVLTDAGPYQYMRRQVASILATNQLQLDQAFPVGASGGYRIENSLDTYNGPYLQQLQAAIATELDTISTRTAPTPPPYIYNSQSEDNALLSFFSTVFTTIQGPSSTGNVSGLMLTDPSAHFIGPDPATPNVNTSYLVYVPLGISGPQEENEGIYAIANVVSDTVLMVSPTFPVAGTVTYQVVSVFGISTTTLQNLFSILQSNATFVQETTTFQSLLADTVPVQFSGVVESAIYANGLNTAQNDINNRYTLVGDRLTFLSPANTLGAQTYIAAALSTTDNLYAARYSWINARINLQSGYLILENTAASTVAVNQAATINQLIQLLTIQHS